jgi:hypothetical protein
MLVNMLIVGAVILAVIVWIAMTQDELPEDKLDESAKIEEQVDDEEDLR